MNFARLESNRPRPVTETEGGKMGLWSTKGGGAEEEMGERRPSYLLYPVDRQVFLGTCVGKSRNLGTTNLPAPACCLFVVHG